MTSKSEILDFACTYTGQLLRKKNSFGEIVSTLKKFGEHYKTFSKKIKNLIFLGPFILVRFQQWLRVFGPGWRPWSSLEFRGTRMAQTIVKTNTRSTFLEFRRIPYPL